jgi:hypothetical protein
MVGFQRYIDREIPTNLFTERSFCFVNSKSEVMIQVADFISGSWARVWEPEKLSPRADEIADLLLMRSVGVDIWPPRTVRPAKLQQETEPATYLRDSLIRQHCYRLAVNFLEAEGESLEDAVPLAPRVVLEYLLFQAVFGDDMAFVRTSDIIKELESVSGSRVSPYELRSTLIAPLRDAGVIVASGPDGYKIPTCESDLRQFATLAQSIVTPMLHRLSIARNELRAVSSGSVDILAATEFTQLRALVDAQERLNVSAATTPLTPPPPAPVFPP